MFLSPKPTAVSKSYCYFWTAYLSSGWPDLSIDLVAAVQRQMNFMNKVVPLIIPEGVVEDETISGGRKRHVKFMAVMKGSHAMLVPTLDVDLFWHTLLWLIMPSVNATMAGV
jgi:hypothetical protein